MQERTKQGGSVLVFSIIGVVLVAAVIGLVFLVNKRADDSLAGPLFEMPNESESSDQSNEGDGASSDEPATEDETEQSNEPEADQSTKANDEPSQSETEPAAPTDDKSGSTDEALPAAGPTETALSGLVLAIMAAAVIAYARSRAQLSELSLTNRD